MNRGLKSIGTLAMATLSTTLLSNTLLQSFDEEIKTAITSFKMALQSSQLVSNAQADEIPPSLTSRIRNHTRNTNQSQTIKTPILTPLPKPNPTENLKKYRLLDAKIRGILEEYRIKTNSPGLTAAVFFNPDCEKYAAPQSVFELDFETEHPAHSSSSFKPCICGDVSCACFDSSSSTCKPCALKALQKDIPRRGFVVYEGAVGLSDIELGTPMRPGTRMKIASISKSFTAILCARLFEAGLLDIDAPVETYLESSWTESTKDMVENYVSALTGSISPVGVTVQGSSFSQTGPPPYSARVIHGASRPFPLEALPLPEVGGVARHFSSISQPTTQFSTQLSNSPTENPDLTTFSGLPFPEPFRGLTIRQLLSHTAGIRGYVGDEFHSATSFPTTISTLIPFAYDPLVHPPGQNFTYTTLGYSVVASVIENLSRATDMSSHTALLPDMDQSSHVTSAKSGVLEPVKHADEQACVYLRSRRTVTPQFGQGNQKKSAEKEFATYSFPALMQSLLLKPLGLTSTVPEPPAGIPLLMRSKQYTRELHTTMPLYVVETLESLISVANRDPSVSSALLRLGTNPENKNISSHPPTPENPSGLPYPVFLSPHTNCSNKFAGGGYLSNARELAMMGGALTGLHPFITPSVLADFWTSLEVPQGDNKGMKRTQYGLGFSVLPTGTASNATAYPVPLSTPDLGSNLITQNRRGELISSDVSNAPWWLGRAVGHSGQAIDGSTYLLILPEEGISVAVMANIGQCNLKPTALAIAKEFHDVILE